MPLKTQIIEIIRSKFSIEESQIASAFADGTIDSIDTVKLMMELEDRYEVSLNDAAFALAMTSVDALTEYITTSISYKHGS